MKTDQSLVQERRQDRIERLHRPDAVAVSPSLANTNTDVGCRCRGRERNLYICEILFVFPIYATSALTSAAVQSYLNCDAIVCQLGSPNKRRKVYPR